MVSPKQLVSYKFTAATNLSSLGNRNINVRERCILIRSSCSERAI